MAEKQKSKSITTPVGTVCFASVFKARAFNDGDPKYSLILVFDKAKLKNDPAWANLKAEVQRAAVEKFGAETVKKLLAKNKFSLPWREGTDYEEYGEPFSDKTMFIKPSSTTAPGIVNGALRKLVSEEDFYSGCTARATAGVWAFDNNGNKGVTLLLNNIQKVADGERLSGSRKDATDDFEKTEEGDDDGDDLFN